jgi:hypothetical protein
VRSLPINQPFFAREVELEPGRIEQVAPDAELPPGTRTFFVWPLTGTAGAALADELHTRLSGAIPAQHVGAASRVVADMLGSQMTPAASVKG